ncbi:MAG: DUF2953 domain-containing protein [Thermoanaerobacterales bacterium]|nr:DUF2953 domain-containing protein [Bacillota bacterium]MDI6906319.1 DUF2953 domain-containing protein [Thermoanaerobacterales bacterium]
MLFLLIIAALLMAGVFLALTFLRVNLAYRREGEDDRVAVLVSWLGLPLYRAEVPMLDLRAGLGRNPAIRLKSRSATDTPATAVDREVRELPLSVLFLRWYNVFKSFRAGICYLTPRIRIEDLDWSTRIGTESADRTGILTGLTWAVKGSLLTLTSRLTDFRAHPRLAVKPDFGRPVFATDIRCILAIRLGHIIVAGLKGLAAHVGGKSGGAAPHPGSDADGHGEH